MSLPDLIEIIPLDKPVRAEITVPGSKSITNRALILAALAEGETTLKGALWSEDTEIMYDCLQRLGFAVNKQDDPDEVCNRTITVNGLSGKIPNAGTVEKPLELFVGNAGTAARFLAAMVCLGNGVYRLSGVPRMHERPQAALFKALRELGCRVESANDKLPVVIHGQPRNAECGMRSCTVSIEESSQFASALLLCAKHGGWDVKVVGENAEESPYVAMTAKLIEVFPSRGRQFQIEPDASSGSYFRALDWILWITGLNHEMGKVTVKNWPNTDWQIDTKYPNLGNLNKSSGVISRKADLGDSIMMAIVKAPFNKAEQSSQFAFPDPAQIQVTKAATPIRFTDLGRLRVQETERVIALRDELRKCGAMVEESGDNLTVYPSTLHGAEIETYNDHRMAMCFAILGLKVPGIKIRNPACVKKTFPNFFQKLAAPPPNGLGVEIRDGRTGRKLGMDELFAE